MAGHVFDFTAPLWLYGGKATWHFLTLPFDVADEIDEITSEAARGFGSVRVQVTIGETTWATSVFPDRKRQSFILPVKASVRKAERLAVDSDCRVRLQLVDFGT